MEEVTNQAKTHLFQWLAKERTLISVSGLRPYSDEDWNDYIGAINQIVDKQIRVLVHSQGAIPNRHQQRQLSALPNQTLRRIAVISPSPAIRFIVSMFLFVAPHIRLFAPDKLDDAFVFLGFSPAEIATVRDVLTRLRRELADEHAA